MSARTMHVWHVFKPWLLSLRQDLVTQMLHVDPGQRLNAGQVVSHPWLLHREALPNLRLLLQDASLVKGAISATYR